MVGGGQGGQGTAALDGEAILEDAMDLYDGVLDD